MHLQWRDRTTGATEDDLTVFPADITLKRIAAPNPDKDRVYEVAFTQAAAGRQPLFFWLQAADASKDADDVAALLKAINEPDVAAAAAAAGGAARGGACACGGGGVVVTSRSVRPAYSSVIVLYSPSLAPYLASPTPHLDRRRARRPPGRQRHRRWCRR